MTSGGSPGGWELSSGMPGTSAGGGDACIASPTCALLPSASLGYSPGGAGACDNLGSVGGGGGGGGCFGGGGGGGANATAPGGPGGGGGSCADPSAFSVVYSASGAEGGIAGSPGANGWVAIQCVVFGLGTSWASQPLAGSGLSSPAAQDGSGDAATFSLPQGIAFNASLGAVVADTGNAMLRAVALDGITTSLTNLGAVPSPQGIAVRTSGDIVIVTGSDVFLLPALLREPSLLVGDEAAFGSLQAVTVNQNDTLLYVVDGPPNNVVRAIDPNSGLVTDVAGCKRCADNKYKDGTGSAAGFASLQAIATLPDGSLVVADLNRIRRVTTNGTVTTLTGSTTGTAYNKSGTTDGVGSAALFFSPQGLAVSANGNGAFSVCASVDV